MILSPETNKKVRELKMVVDSLDGRQPLFHTIPSAVNR